jgi:type VI protein secretion system component Hcp
MTKAVNATTARERDDQARELTDVELSQVSGGSSTSGAGAGKVAFNPFAITKTVDKASPLLF